MKYLFFNYKLFNSFFNLNGKKTKKKEIKRIKRR